MKYQELPEAKDLEVIQVYHTQLWHELMSLFHLYSSLCNEHKHETEYAVARAALFTIFGTIETASRVSATASLLANACLEQGILIDTIDGVQPITKLTHTERMFLRQEVEELDQRKWVVKRRPKFASFEASLIGYPQIYGHLFGQEVVIDKSNTQWQSLNEIKKLRDIGAHGNLATSRAQTYTVTTNDLENLLIARSWYCEQLVNLPWVAGVEAQGEIKAIKVLLKQIAGKKVWH